MELTQLSIVMLTFICEVTMIWPPPYKIHLNHSEDFVIFEQFGNEDSDDIYSDEDEMIKKVDLRSLNVNNDSKEFLRIHKLAIREGYKQVPDGKMKKRIKWPENNYETEDDNPWVAGYFKSNQSNLFSENSNVYYLNEMAKSQMEYKFDEKRSQPETDGQYDYALFKQEYENDIKIAKGKNDTLDFVDVTEEENLKDVVKNMVNFSQIPRNCTKEEIKGIGVAAVECFWYDFKKVDTKESRILLFKRIMKLILVWVIIYILIAVPCWCQKGWCCCCFQCRFCKPTLRIDGVKKFIADNPPGVYHKNGKLVKYKSTHYEKYAHKRLEQALSKL